jgi:hypothetical protein
MYILLDLVFNIISFMPPSPKYLPNELGDSKYVQFVGLAYQCKDIVFRFIIEYSRLMDFGPQAVGLFLYEDFWKMIFGLCWNLRLVIELYYLERAWFLLKDFLKIIFFHGEIFEFP